MERSLIKEYEYFHSAEIYGFGGRHFHFILPHVLALRPGSLVDYGAGRSDTARRLGRKAHQAGVHVHQPASPATMRTNAASACCSAISRFVSAVQ